MYRKAHFKLAGVRTHRHELHRDAHLDLFVFKHDKRGLEIHGLVGAREFKCSVIASARRLLKLRVGECAGQRLTASRFEHFVLVGNRDESIFWMA